MKKGQLQLGHMRRSSCLQHAQAVAATLNPAGDLVIGWCTCEALLLIPPGVPTVGSSTCRTGQTLRHKLCCLLIRPLDTLRTPGHLAQSKAVRLGAVCLSQAEGNDLLFTFILHFELLAALMEAEQAHRRSAPFAVTAKA